MKTVKLVCGHETEWFEWGGPGQEDLPWRGQWAWCGECGEDTEILEVPFESYNQGAFLKISIFWEHDSFELFNLPDDNVVTCGNDGMEVLGSASTIRAMMEAVEESGGNLTAEEPYNATEEHFQAAIAFSEGRFEDVQDVVSAIL